MRPFDPTSRQLFRQLLAARLAAAFPEARVETIHNGPWLLVTFPEGACCGVCLPRYAGLLVLQGPDFDPAPVFARAIAAVRGQRRQLQDKIDA